MRHANVPATVETGDTTVRQQVGHKEHLQRSEQGRLDKGNGIDSEFLEYLYLPDLSFVFKNFQLTEKYGIDKKYWDDTISALTHKVRNTIAHPYKRLIKNQKSVKDLHKIIVSMNHLIEKLK